MTRTTTRSALIGSNMMRTTLAALIAATLPLAASAQDTGNASMYERNVYQQQRIEQGLRDGSLTVQEAANLERGQARVSQMEARALADGRLSDAERARIHEAQNRQSGAIDRERSDGQRGDPTSRSAQRMAADVHNNANEQRRIAQGVQSGQITNREAARLEHGQARIFGQEARAGADGRIDRHEQRHLQGTQHHQSQAIRHERHDGQFRPHGQSQGQDRSWHRGDGAGQSGYMGRGAGSGVSANNVAATPRTQGNNGNHYGQFNRTNTVAQNSGNGGGRGHGNGRDNRR